jgi:hypothetical protein
MFDNYITAKKGFFGTLYTFNEAFHLEKIVEWFTTHIYAHRLFSLSSALIDSDNSLIGCKLNFFGVIIESH